MRELAHHQSADQSYLEEGILLLRLARNAQRLFAQQPPEEQRRLLKFVLSNSNWKYGEFLVDFRDLFNLLAKTSALAAVKSWQGGDENMKHQVWLPFIDAFRNLCIAPKGDFRFMLEEMRAKDHWTKINWKRKVRLVRRQKS